MSEETPAAAAAVPGHRSDLPPCPFLPGVEDPLDHRCMDVHGQDRGPAFYETAIHYAHSLWLQGYPARAILLLNRAMGADITGMEPVVMRFPIPYRAMAWLLMNRLPDQFIGNPRRHWQHLATRMSGPRAAVRTWRAWACWQLARIVMPDCPADGIQIEVDGLREPVEQEIAARLDELGLPGESGLWQIACRDCREGVPSS